MAKVVSIERGRRGRVRAAKAQLADLEKLEQDTGMHRLKVPFLAVAVVAAICCLCAVIQHTLSLSGDKELSVAQAQTQAQHKYHALKPFGSS